MRKFLVFCLLNLCIASSFARLISKSEADEPRLLFVFGDSYADTGNTPPNTTSAWHVPYGVSWPGFPSGRFSNGFVGTDALASALGFRSPIPYAKLSVNTTTSVGVNFAVGGSGATYAFGMPTFEAQVGWFAGLVNGGVFPPEALSRSVIFVSVTGNDYSAYNGSLAGYIPFVHEVTRLTDVSLRTLYSLGARNFMVSAIAPLACLPRRTIASGFAECERNASVDRVTALHDHLLGNRLENFTRNLEKSSISFLRQSKAMKYILDHLSEFDLKEGLKPCCVGMCSSYDDSGKPLFTVCDNPDEHFFWDSIHPTQAGWRAIVDLYTNHSHFTRFSRTLRKWLKGLSP